MQDFSDLGREWLLRFSRRLPALTKRAELPAEIGSPRGTVKSRAVGLRGEAHALGVLAVVEPRRQMIERKDALLRFWRGEARGLRLRVGERDRLDGLDPPGAIELRQMHLRHQPVVAANAEAGHLCRAGMQEIAEPIEDQRFPIDLHALHHMGVMAENEVDALGLGGEAPPVGKLPLVRHDTAFEPVMDGEDAVVRRHAGKLLTTASKSARSR